MTPRQMTLGVNLFTAAVVISVAVALAGLTWRLMGEPGGKPRAVASAVAVPAPANVDLTPILALAPFGSAAPTRPSGQGGSIAGLTLKGIVRAIPAFRSTALIASAGGAAEVFAVGAVLPGGAVLDAIEIDHVLVRANGRQEILGFPEKIVATAASTAGVDAIRAAIPASVSGLAPTAPPAPAALLNSAAATGAAIEQYRDRIAASPQTLVGTLGAVATPQGYRIGPSPSAQMRAAGLAPGDVVEKINGVQVGDAQRDARLFDEAVASGRARVEVIRDGRRIILSFPLR